MKKEVLCETIEREISTPVLFDTKEQARAEMVRRFKEAMNLTDEEFKTMDNDTSEYFCGENEAYCVNANHDNCDWSIFTVEDTSCDTCNTNGILTTGTVFTAKGKYSVQYKCEFLGMSLEHEGYVCLRDVDSNTIVLVTPGWFRQKEITIN